MCFECLWKPSYRQTNIPFHKTAAVGNCHSVSPNSFAYDPVQPQCRILSAGRPMHTAYKCVDVSFLGFVQVMSVENCYNVNNEHRKVSMARSQENDGRNERVEHRWGRRQERGRKKRSGEWEGGSGVEEAIIFWHFIKLLSKWQIIIFYSIRYKTNKHTMHRSSEQREKATTSDKNCVFLSI